MRRLSTGVIIGAVAIMLIYFFQWLLPETVDTWNHRLHDRLFQFRAASETFKPNYDDTIVHVDVNQSTLQRLNRRHIDRHHHARVIANLAAMGTAAQMYDYVFASRRSPNEDRSLIEATLVAGNVYFGLVFLFEQTREQQASSSAESPPQTYLNADHWKIPMGTEAEAIPAAVDAIVTFPELADASQGLGSLNLRYDADGVYRRYPLLYRFKGAIYPSIVLRIACDYLQVASEAVVLEPGPFVRLASARFPGSTAPSDVLIPIEPSGHMIVDFIGGWDRMRHYNFSDVLQASENEAEMPLWKGELGGKIVVVSEVLSGSSDAGPIPTDTHFPLSGVHASALHTILTESFFTSLPAIARFMIVLTLVTVALAAFTYLPAMGFAAAILITASTYSGIAIIAFLQSRVQFDFIVPSGVLAVILISMLVHRAIESTRLSLEAERERDLVEKELEIGRRIQADFYPPHLPDLSGWDLAATIRPAKHVAGDFYDIFAVDGNRSLALVIGDVCDKGVGAAMFMALFRSLIRALSLQQTADLNEPLSQKTKWIQELLQSTIQQTNNYIAVTHEQACMFATLFFGVLDTKTGDLHYVNCGHEPPMLLRTNGRLDDLPPTGPAAGSFPDIAFRCQSVQMSPGDLFFACTDGVIESPDPNDQIFSKDRLEVILQSPHRSLADMLGSIENAVDKHSQGQPQFDDITMIAVKRKSD
jgi:serine phosphatase RsbU (regulator of sigma subunit)/CHASE2 domain-containing sensor protein